MCNVKANIGIKNSLQVTDASKAPLRPSKSNDFYWLSYICYAKLVLVSDTFCELKYYVSIYQVKYENSLWLIVSQKCVFC